MGSDGGRAAFRGNAPRLMSFLGVPLPHLSPGRRWVQLGLLRWVRVCWSIPPWCLGERKGGDGERTGILGCILKSRLVLVLSKDGVQGPKCVWGEGRVCVSAPDGVRASKRWQLGVHFGVCRQV